MKLTVLTENIAGRKFGAEHGLSYLLENDDERILFDTGHSDLFLTNALKLGIAIQKDIHKIVLSHGHWDHGDGLQFIKNKTLITHPSSFIKRYRKNDQTNIGLAMDRSAIEHNFDLIVSKTPYVVGKNMMFLGEIPRLTDFESQSTPYVDDNGEPDFIPDDSALAIIQGDDLVVVTGCSHAGICNIIEYAKKVTGLKKVKTVIGGFHLKRCDRQTENTIAYFREQQVKNIHPSHCTELPALAEFYKAFGVTQVRTGMVFDL